MDKLMENLPGIAAVITALGTPITLIAVAYLNRKVTHIDHAVNGKEPGQQSMVSQVADIHLASVPKPTASDQPMVEQVDEIHAAATDPPSE